MFLWLLTFHTVTQVILRAHSFSSGWMLTHSAAGWMLVGEEYKAGFTCFEYFIIVLRSVALLKLVVFSV